MKLKLVVASMSVLQEMAATHDYKDMGALPPVVNDWYNRISLDGGINFDSVWGNRKMGYMGENYTRLSVNNAFINLNANINDWAKAFVALSFDNTSGLLTGANTTATGNPLSNIQRPKPGHYENIKDSAGVNIEQAFITLANFTDMPLYLKLGNEFVDFGKYDPHAITQTFAQTMTETLRTAATLGFSTQMGLRGSVYTFNNPMQKPAHSKPNYGAMLEYGMPSDQLGYDIGLGYLYDFTGVNDVAYGVSAYNGTNVTGGVDGGPAVAQVNVTGPGGAGTYSSVVSAGTIYGDLNTGPFDFNLRFVSAFKHFASTDLATSNVATTSATGAKPWALDLMAGYKFVAWTKTSNVYLGFQDSSQALNLYLPKNRWLLGVGTEMWKNTNVALQWNYDTDYGIGVGGTGKKSSLIDLRVGVKFG